MSRIVHVYSVPSLQHGKQLADSACLLAAGETPFYALDLRSFSTFINRSVHLEALIMHHTGAPAMSLCVCVLVILFKADILQPLCAGLACELPAQFMGSARESRACSDLLVLQGLAMLTSSAC